MLTAFRRVVLVQVVLAQVLVLAQVSVREPALARELAQESVRVQEPVRVPPVASQVSEQGRWAWLVQSVPVFSALLRRAAVATTPLQRPPRQAPDGSLRHRFTQARRIGGPFLFGHLRMKRCQVQSSPAIQSLRIVIA